MRGINSINEFFTEEEFKSLKQKKGDLSWHDFILTLLSDKNGVGDKQKRRR